MSEMVIDGDGYPYLDGYPIPVNTEIQYLATQMLDDQTSFSHGVKGTSFDHFVRWHSAKQSRGAAFMDSYYTLAGTEPYKQDEHLALKSGMARGVAFMFGIPLFLQALRGQIDFNAPLEPQIQGQPYSAYPNSKETFSTVSYFLQHCAEELPEVREEFMNTATVLGMLQEAWLYNEEEFLKAGKGIRDRLGEYRENFTDEEWQTVRRGIIAGTAIVILWFRYENARRSHSN